MAEEETPPTDKEWQDVLSPERFSVMRAKINEEPHSGEFANHFETGEYSCAACGQKLFSSETKFDAGTGWPSFSEPIGEDAIMHNHAGTWESKESAHYGVADDADGSLTRTDVACSNCEGHLGHVFQDGPHESGKRYCLNSLSLQFK